MKLIVTVILALGSIGSVWAVRAPQRERMSPVRQDFRVGGLRRPTTDFSYLRSALLSKAARRTPSKFLKAALSIPTRWDSREHGWVTSIKNQGSHGTCWAFATMASLETAFLKASGGSVTNDLSENHLATHDVGFGFGFGDGGNNQLAAALLTSWRDPLLESEDPYPNPGSTVTVPPQCHVQDIVWLPERFCPGFNTKFGYAVDALEDNREVDASYKRAIMAYGAVSVGYYHAWNHYNSQTAAHCFQYDTYSANDGDGGHAVTLIGWDDDYPAENFVSGRRPKGNGAFLVKNSWGRSSNTSNGCSWISYYDEAINYMPGAAYPLPGTRDNYGRVYEYDPCGQVASWNVCDTDAEQALGNVTNWCANVFTATASGVIEAVGFYAMSADTAYSLRVYRNCTSSPSDGELMSEQRGTVADSGFATIPLVSPVPVNAAGTKFSVVLQLTCPGYDYPLPVECTHYEKNEDGEDVLWCACTANAGESFMSRDGRAWRDFHDYDPTGNFCVKAYTRYGSDGEASKLIVSSSPESDSVLARVGDPRTFAVTAEAASEGEALSYAWRVNGVPADCAAAEFVFTPTFAQHGNCAVECLVQSGVSVDVRKWTLVVNADLHVRSGSAAADPDGSPERPFSAIQDAIRAAIEGDVVLVGPGVYFGTVEGPSAKIEIRSTEGPEATVLDARGAGRCYLGAQNANTVVSGFTLRNAGLPNGFGGGVCSGVITNCVITNCVGGAGGGAYDSVLLDCRFVDCAAQYGGGICDSRAFGCLFSGNSASEGSAAGGYDFGSEIYGCTVCENLSDPDGGAVDGMSYCQDSIVWGNFDVYGGVGNWGWCRYGYYWYATEFAFSCTAPEGFTDDGGCTTENPRLAAVARGDVRLTTGSPCIGVASDGRNMGCDQGEALTNSVLEVGRGCAWASIQDALDAAVYGDCVRVHPGVYPGVANQVESVRIESVAGPSETVIDGGGLGRCFDDYGRASLSGFALVNGFAPEDDCGGGTCYGELVGCVISNCTAGAGGGAAFADLVNCLVCDNRAAVHGGGTYESTLCNCTVSGNSAAEHGGGAYVQTVTAANSVIAANSSDAGSDSGDNAFGAGCGWMICCLVDRDAKFADAAHGNYRLSANSPCIDAGDNEFVFVTGDLDGTNRIFGARVDMGCYEYCRTVPGWTVPEVSPDATPANESAAVAAAMKSVGFTGERAAALTSVAQYNALSAWAADHGIGIPALVASSTAFISPALAAAELLELEPEDLKVSEFAPSGAGLGWTLKLDLDAYDPQTVNPALLKAAVGVMGADSPDGRYSSDGLGVSINPDVSGIEISVTPPADRKACFLKSIVR